MGMSVTHRLDSNTAESQTVWSGTAGFYGMAVINIKTRMPANFVVTSILKSVDIKIVTAPMLGLLNGCLDIASRTPKEKLLRVEKLPKMPKLYAEAVCDIQIKSTHVSGCTTSTGTVQKTRNLWPHIRKSGSAGLSESATWVIIRGQVPLSVFRRRKCKKQINGLEPADF